MSCDFAHLMQDAVCKFILKEANRPAWNEDVDEGELQSFGNNRMADVVQSGGSDCHSLTSAPI